MVWVNTKSGTHPTILERSESPFKKGGTKGDSFLNIIKNQIEVEIKYGVNFLVESGEVIALAIPLLYPKPFKDNPFDKIFFSTIFSRFNPLLRNRLNTLHKLLWDYSIHY